MIYMHVLLTSDVFCKIYHSNSIGRVKEQTVLNTITFIVIKIQFKDQYVTFIVLISLLNKDYFK
jgi:hypothetical protein